MITLPNGATLLTADEAVDAVVTGSHPDGAAGSVPMDAALVAALRAGLVLACRYPDGKLAFTRN